MPTEVPVKLKLKAADKITAVLKKATKGFDRLKAATRRASNGMKNFQEKTKGIRSALSKVGSGMKNVGKNLTAKVSLPIVGLGVGIIKTAATFEKSMNKVKALSGATGDAFVALRDEAARLGSSTQFSASQAADGMAFLAQAGFKTNDILKATAPLLDLAAASNTDLARTADIASNVMGAFGIKAEETARVADVLARATAGSNVDLNMIAESMKDAAPLAKNFGASLEETTAAIGLLGNIGIQGSKAGTALKNAFLNLSAPTKKSKKALELLGIQVSDSQGNMLKFGDIMKNLGSRLSQLPQKARLQALNLIFGKIGIAAATNLAKVAETGDLKKFTDAMHDTEITASSMAKTMNQGASGAMVTIKSAMEGLAIAIAGSGPNSPLSAFTSIVRKIAEFVQQISKSNPKFFKIAIVAGMVVAALGPLLLIFGSLISIIPALITIAGALGVSFTAFAGVIAGIPVLIAGLIAAGYLLVNNWESVEEFFVGLGITIWESLTGIWDGIKAKFNEGLNFLKGKIADVLSFIPDFVKKRVGITPEFEKSLTQKDVFEKLGGNLGVQSEQIQRNVIELGREKQLRRANDTTKNENKVMVEFANAPKGMKIKTESTNNSLFDIDTGLQASSL